MVPARVSIPLSSTRHNRWPPPGHASQGYACSFFPTFVRFKWCDTVVLWAASVPARPSDQRWRWPRLVKTETENKSLRQCLLVFEETKSSRFALFCRGVAVPSCWCRPRTSLTVYGTMGQKVYKFTNSCDCVKHTQPQKEPHKHASLRRPASTGAPCPRGAGVAAEP